MKQRRYHGSLMIALSLFVALFFTLLPLPTVAGWFRPLWLLMVLCYWSMALEDRVGVGLAWLLGIVLDLLQGTLFGEHALAMCCCIYFVAKWRRKIRLFSLWQQSFFIALISAFYQLIIYSIQNIIGETPNIILFWLPLVTTVLLWSWLFVLLRDIRRRFKIV